MDSASASLTKCYWLIDRFVKMASSSDEDNFLRQERFRLPNDYQTNERPKKQTVEEVDFSTLKLYRQSKLNSWNQTCANFPSPQYDESDVELYVHQPTDIVLYQWEVTSTDSLSILNGVNGPNTA